ncbi:MAG: hypothetical protein H0U46_01680 [Actinobacteria bacterium]|nr:hypothetical protein [Actinomycetota bacterium]
MGSKLEELKALGWREGRRGNPWVVVLEKDYPNDDVMAMDGALPELQAAMGEYFLSDDESRELAANLESWPPLP